MISDNPVLTVEEIYKQAMPLGTTIIAAGDAQARPVRWVVAMEPDSQAPYLEGGELVLLSPGKGDAVAMIRTCAEANVAAIATLSPLSPLALANAEAAHLPVMQLPSGTRIRDVERVVVGLLLDRQGHVERRSTQIYQQLVQLASENAGLEQIIHELA